MTAPGPSLLADPAPPRDGADATERVGWLRARLRLYALDLAVLEAFAGLGGDAAADELGAAADGFAGAAGACDDVVRLACAAEREAAAASVGRLCEELRRAVSRLARERAPGREIMAAAHQACERSGAFVPAPLLLARARALAHQAAGPRRRRHAA